MVTTEFERMFNQLSDDEKRDVKIAFEEEFPGATVILIRKVLGSQLTATEAMWTAFKLGYVRGKQKMALMALDLIKELT